MLRNWLDVSGNSWIGLILLSGAPAWAADAIQPLAIKPGFWEISTTEGARTTTVKSCIAARDLEQPLQLPLGGDPKGCRQTLVGASATRQETRLECGRRSASIVIEATDSAAAKAVAEWSDSQGAAPVKTTVIARLRWLGAECEEGPDHYYQLGMEQSGRGEFWEALRLFNKAIELDPRRPAFYNARGYAYLRLHSYANAILEFSEAIRLRPDYSNALHNRATARRHAGDIAGAEEDERKAAALENRK